MKKLKTNHAHMPNQEYGKHWGRKDFDCDTETDFIADHSDRHGAHSSFNTSLYPNPVNERVSSEGFQAGDYYPWNETFMWNYHLLKEFFSIVSDKKWVLPIIHGYINCSNFEIKWLRINVILIARRSRHFAGTRYLKRGLNEEGRVANFVEIEQIVYSQNSKDDKPLVSSYVQVRGSVPLFWTQDPNPLIAKPEIFVNTSDIDYLATKRHFWDLFQQYSHPLIIFNLTKKADTRECRLSSQYQYAVEQVLNEDLPEDKKIFYAHFDVKKAKKKNFSGLAFAYINSYIRQTGVFYTEVANREESKLRIHVQRGIVRTNCIDSLDRTNLVQQCIGIAVLEKQLKALNILEGSETLQNWLEVCSTFQKYFEIMGDEISLQYGGSIAHHANLTKKKGFFKSAIPELWTSVKRHWANNFSDSSKQGAINLFLGMYVPLQNSIQLWNLESDIILHQWDKDKLPRLLPKWWEHYFKRFEEKLPRELRNDSLVSYIPYDALMEIQKTFYGSEFGQEIGKNKDLAKALEAHFLPGQKISTKAVLEVNEMENITKDHRHLYIFDAIEQQIKKDIDLNIKLHKQKQDMKQSMISHESIISVESRHIEYVKSITI